jgi:hypothetical protein
MTQVGFIVGVYNYCDRWCDAALAAAACSPEQRLSFDSVAPAAPAPARSRLIAGPAMLVHWRRHSRNCRRSPFTFRRGDADRRRGRTHRGGRSARACVRWAIACGDGSPPSRAGEPAVSAVAVLQHSPPISPGCLRAEGRAEEDWNTADSVPMARQRPPCWGRSAGRRLAATGRARCHQRARGRARALELQQLTAEMETLLARAGLVRHSTGEALAMPLRRNTARARGRSAFMRCTRLAC